MMILDSGLLFWATLYNYIPNSTDVGSLGKEPA